MSAILLDDMIVHYEVLGRGRPVIFLHGWVGSWRYWVPAMQAASVSFRAYALDLWGFGDTARAQDRYALEQQTALLERYLQEMGIGKVALIGHGLGALAALLFTQRFPNTVDRLMAVDCPLNIKSIHGRLRTSSPTDLADWLLAKNPVTEPARADAPKTDPQAIINSLNSLDAINFPSLVDQMRTPCLLVYGQNDPAISLPSNERLQSLHSQVHHIFLEQSGHFPMLDEAARFNRLLTDFLALESGDSPRELQLKEEWRRRVR